MVSLLFTLRRLLSAVFRISKDRLFQSLLLTLSVILFSGTMFYHQAEDWSWTDAFYFSFVSLIPTGVDTGLVPDTPMSKWFTMLYLVVGVGVMLMLLIRLGLAIAKFEMDEGRRASTRLIKKSSR